MATTTFTAGTLITSAWLNDVDAIVYDILAAATTAAGARTALSVYSQAEVTALVDDLSGVTDAATARTNLGLGSIATQASSSVTITGGSISGTDVTVGATKTLDVSAGTLTLANDQIALTKIDWSGSDTLNGTYTVTGTLNISGGTLTLANDQISGNAVDGGTISNFASTGIDDNASATAITIASDGTIGIANTASATLHAANGNGNLAVGSGTGNQGITIYSGNADLSGISFADGTTTTTTYEGYIWYDHSADTIKLGTAHTTRLSIDSVGQAGINNAPVSGVQLAVQAASGKNAAVFYGSANSYAFKVQSSTTSGQGFGVEISGGTGSTDNAFRVVNASGATELFLIRGDGYMYSQTTYSSTTASAANVYVNSDGSFQRSTSAKKSKANISPLAFDVQAIADLLNPVTYTSLCTNDDKQKLHIGFVADDYVGTVLDPLIHYNGNKVEGFQYERMTAVLTVMVKDLLMRVNELEAKVGK